MPQAEPEPAEDDNVVKLADRMRRATNDDAVGVGVDVERSGAHGPWDFALCEPVILFAGSAASSGTAAPAQTNNEWARPGIHVIYESGTITPLSDDGFVRLPAHLELPPDPADDRDEPSARTPLRSDTTSV